MQRVGPLKQYVLWALCFSKTLTELLFYYSIFLLHFGGLAWLFILKWMVFMLTFELSHDCVPFQWSKFVSCYVHYTSKRYLCLSDSRVITHQLYSVCLFTILSVTTFSGKFHSGMLVLSEQIFWWHFLYKKWQNPQVPCMHKMSCFLALGCDSNSLDSHFFSLLLMTRSSAESA